MFPLPLIYILQFKYILKKMWFLFLVSKNCIFKTQDDLEQIKISFRYKCESAVLNFNSQCWQQIVDWDRVKSLGFSKWKVYKVRWWWDAGSILSLSFMSTCSSATFLSCQSTSEMYCLSLGSLGLCFYLSTVMRW